MREVVFRQILLFLLLLCRVGSGDGVCLRMFSALNEGPARNAAFWASETPVQAGRGRNNVFRFGFDAELWHVADVIGIIAKDPEALLNASNHLVDQKDFYSVEQVQQMLGLESKEATLAVLAAPEEDLIVLTDIQPAALRKWKHGNVHKARYARLLHTFVDQSLKNRKIPVFAELEEYSGANEGETAVELVMEGAIESPAQFKKLIDWLYEEVDAPETHFHVSVPKKFIESDAMIFAARALETKILLEQAVSGQDFKGQGHYPWDVTTLNADIHLVRNDDRPLSERGVVRVDSERWEDPITAHDIEVRDWLDKDHGLESLFVLTELAKQSGKLRDSTNFSTNWVRKQNPANLNSALRYAAFMLEGKLPRGKDHIRTELIQLAQLIERQRTLDEPLREKVAKYLKENDVLYHLNLNTFLNGRIMPANAPLPVVELPPDPLPETSVADGLRTAYTRDVNGVIRIPVSYVKESGPEKPVAEFVLDPQKASRQSAFKVVPGEKVSFFDWEEPAKTDTEQVRTSGLAAIGQAFTHFGRDRLVAIGRNNYERTNLGILGFKVIRGTELDAGGPRYELRRDDFKGQLVEPHFTTKLGQSSSGRRSVVPYATAALPENRVENGIHYEYYIPNEYEPHVMRMSIEKVPAREGGRPKHLAEFILDTEKPTRLKNLRLWEGDAFFDWEEATRVADSDYDTVYEAGKKFMAESFTNYKLGRLVATGNTQYSKAVLEELGFTVMANQEPNARELLYEYTHSQHQQNARAAARTSVPWSPPSPRPR